MHNSSLTQSSLGKSVAYIQHYAPRLLFPVARSENRQTIAISDALPFKGSDVWNAYEMSWLNAEGKPIVAIAQFVFPCSAPFIVESKSFKLYLNSFNQTVFPGTDNESFTAVKNALVKDLSHTAGAPVIVHLIPLDDYSEKLNKLAGTCLDHLDVSCDQYDIHVDYLQTENQDVTESVYSHLLKSNCPITGQPDWGSVHIEYSGKKINPQGLLKYVVSFREHNEFHEHCVERIFTDIMRLCQPQKLTVAAFYTRRGGLDINPIRSTEELDFFARFKRLARQ